MAEDETTETAEEEKSIWEVLGVEEPEDEEQDYSEVEADAEADAEKEDKVAKKLNNRIDNLEKKFRQGKLQEAKNKFLEVADPLEADLFRAIVGDVKDPETLDHAITLVKQRSAEMKATMEKAEAEAREQVAKSWGVANPGRAPQPSDDEQKKMEEAIAAGDTKAGFAAIMGDDDFLRGRI